MWMEDTCMKICVMVILCKVFKQELHRLAGVPEGLCGLQELEMFQKALSPECQIFVLTVDKPHMNTNRGQENSTHSNRSELSWLYFVWKIFKQILFLF